MGTTQKSLEKNPGILKPLDAKRKIEDLLAAAQQPVAIFDLDGTVFDVSYRTLEILKRFSKFSHIAEKYRDMMPAMGKLSIQDIAYNVEGTLNNLGIGKYSEHSAHFVHDAETFWFQHFFTDELVQYDLPYAGARECVQFFKTRGAHIVYLSGRDVPNMSRGTLSSLENHGFPNNGHGVTLCLKPAYGQDDFLFKKQALETIQQEGNVVATFDNEPANVQLFLDSFPDGFHFHFKSHYSKHLDLSGQQFCEISSFSELEFVNGH